MSMEDIERLKKISQMSRELQKHGIAGDSQDALKQSEEIYQTSAPRNMQVNADLTSSHVDHEDPSQNNIPASPEATTAEAASANQMSTGMAADLTRFQNTVNGRLNQVEESVGQIIGKMNEMIKIVNKLEARLEQGGVPELPRETQQTIVEPKETESQSRSGEYKPSDVEIDKIFYYGNK